MRSILAVRWALVLCAVAPVPLIAAPIHELTMRAPVVIGDHSFWFYYDSRQHMRNDDIATLTVRYEAADTPDLTPSPGSALYKNVITYFSFGLERNGIQTYFGEISGRFGQVVVTDDAFNVNTGLTFDRIDFRIRDEYRGPGGGPTANYPSGTRSGTIPAPDMLPGIDTGTQYGDLLFKNFDLHFTTADGNAISGTSLGSDLAGVVFTPQIGNGIWRARADLTNDNNGNYQRGASFGGGTPRDPNDLPRFEAAFRAQGSSQPGSTPIPEPGGAALIALGIASIALLRTRRARPRVRPAV